MNFRHSKPWGWIVIGLVSSFLKSCKSSRNLNRFGARPGICRNALAGILGAAML